MKPAPTVPVVNNTRFRLFSGVRLLIALYSTSTEQCVSISFSAERSHFYPFSNLAFKWSDCLKVRCMPIFVDKALQRSGLKQENIDFLSEIHKSHVSTNLCHCGDTHMDNQVSGDVIWASEETYFSSYLKFAVLFLYYRLQMLLFFVSALCFAWLSASSDPSASYPVLWQGQGLLETSLQLVKRIKQRMSCDLRTVIKCCLIGAFDNVSSKVMVAVACVPVFVQIPTAVTFIKS